MSSASNVDIGGAAARGRPPTPVIQTVVFENGVPKVLDAAGQIIAEGQGVDLAELKVGEIPKDVAQTLRPGTLPAYPEQHPGNNPNIERIDGVLHPQKGQVLTKAPVALGDVRQGYSTGPIGSAPAPVVVAKEPVPAPAVAVGHDGEPLIEVIYHLSAGSMVSYYHRVERDDRWLVLIFDNKRPAVQRFIPKPSEVANPMESKIKITVTGKDRQSYGLEVIPLGINLKVDYYDLSVMMIVASE